MPRRKGPWWRASHKKWYAYDVDGNQVSLGVSDPNNRLAAEAAYEALLLRLKADLSPAPPANSGLVRDLVTEYLGKCEAKVRADKMCFGTLRGYRFALATHFAAKFGPRAVHTLTAEEVEEWGLDPKREWSRTYRSNTLGAVQTFLRWAKHPLAIHRPAKESRGASSVLSDEEFETVLSHYDSSYGGDFAELIRVIRLTGARPQEIASLPVEAVDWTNQCATLTRHKTARHGGVRILVFVEEAIQILLRQRDKHGSGHLFCPRAGKAYREKRIVQIMQRLSERSGIHAIAYGVGRHSFATQALADGESDAAVAALLGHRDTKMIHTNYSHVAESTRLLKQTAQRIANRKRA